MLAYTEHATPFLLLEEKASSNRTPSLGIYDIKNNIVPMASSPHASASSAGDTSKHITLKRAD
jgi:hypothetical protein